MWYTACCYNPVWILVIPCESLWYPIMLCYENPCSTFWHLILEIIPLSSYRHKKHAVHNVLVALKLICPMGLWYCIQHIWHRFFCGNLVVPIIHQQAKATTMNQEANSWVCIMWKSQPALSTVIYCMSSLP